MAMIESVQFKNFKVLRDAVWDSFLLGGIRAGGREVKSENAPVEALTRLRHSPARGPVGDRASGGQRVNGAEDAWPGAIFRLSDAIPYGALTIGQSAQADHALCD
jgi:hypothetical protein